MSGYIPAILNAGVQLDGPSTNAFSRQQPLVSHQLNQLEFLELAGDHVLVSNNDGGLGASDISVTELNCLSGISGNIQSQLGSKSPTAHTHTLAHVTDVTATAADLNRLQGVTPGTATGGKALIADSNRAIANIGLIEIEGGGIFSRGTATDPSLRTERSGEIAGFYGNVFSSSNFQHCPRIQSFRGRGTASARSQTLSGDFLFRLMALGCLPSGLGANTAEIRAVTTEHTTPTAHGTQWQILSCANGQTVPAVAAAFQGSESRFLGGVGITGPLRIGQYTVGTLPTSGTSARCVFATNGRKAGEGAGAGTGVPVYDDGISWKTFSTDLTVAD